MSLAVVVLSAAVASALPTWADSRSPVRCSPTPYYVADREEAPVADRQPDQTRSTRLAPTEKRTRPCYLSRNRGPPTGNPLRLT